MLAASHWKLKVPIIMNRNFLGSNVALSLINNQRGTIGWSDLKKTENTIKTIKIKRRVLRIFRYFHVWTLNDTLIEGIASFSMFSKRIKHMLLEHSKNIHLESSVFSSKWAEKSLKVLYGLIILHHIQKSVFWNVGR